MADPKVFLKKTSHEDPLVTALTEKPEEARNQVQNKVASKVAMNSARVSKGTGAKIQVHRKHEGLTVVLTAPKHRIDAARKTYESAVNR